MMTTAPRPPAPRRLLLAAFGDPGHAFPMLALGQALVARGHDVCLETWRRWRPHVEAAGMTFAAAPEYQVFPTRERPLHPYEAAVPAAEVTRRLVADWRPDGCVSDILTVAPALACELEGVPVATLIPHLFPYPDPGLPPFSIGARLPRSRTGERLWRLADRLAERGLREGRDQYNASRALLGLAPLPHLHTALSRELTLVATLPQLEYPRDWPPWARVVGPLLWEPPGGSLELPPGTDPLVLIAPSTSQDPERSLLRAALEGLAREPVRVIAAHDERAGGSPLPAPDNARLVPWISYAATMPACDLVVTHGGHGTLARALASGCPVVVCPAGGDMLESAARVAWAGLGLRLPRRLLGPRTLALAIRRALRDDGMRDRARAVAQWLVTHDAAGPAIRDIEAWLATGSTADRVGSRRTAKVGVEPGRGS